MVALAEAGRAFAADAKLELGVLLRKYRGHPQKLEQLRQILRQIYRVGRPVHAFHRLVWCCVHRVRDLSLSRGNAAAPGPRMVGQARCQSRWPVRMPLPSCSKAAHTSVRRRQRLRTWPCILRHRLTPPPADRLSPVELEALAAFEVRIQIPAPHHRAIPAQSPTLLRGVAGKLTEACCFRTAVSQPSRSSRWAAEARRGAQSTTRCVRRRRTATVS